MGNLCGGGDAAGAAGGAPSRRRAARAPTFSAVHARLRRDAAVRDCYRLGRTLGAGGFSVVKLATDRATGEVGGVVEGRRSVLRCGAPWRARRVKSPPPPRRAAQI
jgi:hypothetical protein